MPKMTIADNHRTLLRDGKPFFWLADTCWSAFTNISMDEWTEYLELREKQGFNVLQINALPQWDRCGSEQNLFPFPTEDGFQFDVNAPLNPEYFSHACDMCRQAVAHGFTLAIVVMWCNYVPKTWASDMQPFNVLPEDRVEPVVRTICESFQEFEPVYIISGDTGFDSPESVERYQQVTAYVEQYAPEALKGYHIKGRYDGLPEELAQHADVYFYQSGHNSAGQHNTYELAQSFRKRKQVKPIINSEPCYEQMGYSGRKYGRFRREQTRWALWNSLLSGATAGITYGAHGVWNWFKEEFDCNPDDGESFLQGPRCSNAMKMPGAQDYAFAKKLWMNLGLTDVVPCQEILNIYQDSIRAARDERHVLLYVPTAATFTLNGDFSDYVCQAIDLMTQEQIPCAVEMSNGCAKLKQLPCYGDALIILEKPSR